MTICLCVGPVYKAHCRTAKIYTERYGGYASCRFFIDGITSCSDDFDDIMKSNHLNRSINGGDLSTGLANRMSKNVGISANRRFLFPLQKLYG